MNPKIGVGITTFNNEQYFSELYKTIPFDKIDELVVVNGGDKYENTYDHCDWIQHHKNRLPAICRNDCISTLLNKNCDYIFIIEDDMILKNPDVFQKYIEASLETGLKYLCFTSTSYGSGKPDNRTPSLVVEYKNDVKIALYPNMTNEFTMHHRSCFDEMGLYDSSEFDIIFDVEYAYREAKLGKWASEFWWFADISNSDAYVGNNPNTVSRFEEKRKVGLADAFNRFAAKYGVGIPYIPKATKESALDRLRSIHKNK